jgi:hypothetical protein
VVVGALQRIDHAPILIEVAAVTDSAKKDLGLMAMRCGSI